MREKNEIRDLTTGSVSGKLYRFAMPILCTNLLQAVYNVVDMMIVGRFLGSAGITAVNVGGQVVMVVFVVISAFSNAISVLIGQLIGAGRKKEIPFVVNTALILFLLLAVILTVGIIGCSDLLIRLLNVPAEAVNGTKSYLIIYMCGTCFVYTYNVLYGLLRGIGESTAPMVFAMISSGVNILLDFLFVAVLSLGVSGAALATILSQALSMVLMIRFVAKRVPDYHLARSEFHLDREKRKQLINVGFPQMVQLVLTNISYLFISSLVNSYGLESAAAVGAINKIYTFAVIPGQAMMTAIITMTAQNLPGKNYRRVLQGLGYGCLLAFLISAAVWGICELFPGALLGAFTTEAEVLAIGIPFMRIFICCILIENVMFCMFGLLTGAGYTNITMSCALVSTFVVRYAFSYVLSSMTPLGFHGIAVAYILAPCASLTISGLYTLSGRWKKPRVRV
ncbi:MAG: MATE family efflux transporter [Clostridiales bacterium]|nr:MATE family efflux transporter [Clostridiales bacterium]